MKKAGSNQRRTTRITAPTPSSRNRTKNWNTKQNNARIHETKAKPMKEQATLTHTSKAKPTHSKQKQENNKPHRSKPNRITTLNFNITSPETGKKTRKTTSYEIRSLRNGKQNTTPSKCPPPPPLFPPRPSSGRAASPVRVMLDQQLLLRFNNIEVEAHRSSSDGHRPRVFLRDNVLRGHV